MPKTILIAGAASELGRSMAEDLARAGHRVFASMREPYERNREAANRLWARGIDVVPLDVADEESVGAAVQAVRRKARRIDVLINNARVAMIGAIEAFTPQQAQDVLNTNVVGAIRLAQAVLPGMRREKAGLIVHIGSVLGRVSLPYFGVHSAGKFALEALTDSLRYELSPFGIDVVLVQQSVSPVSARLLTVCQANEAAPSDVAAQRPMMLAQMSAKLEMARVPEAHAVCGAIRSLVDQPFGTRPYRMVVGQTFGADLLNQLAERMQREALEAVRAGAFGGFAAQSEGGV